MKREHCFDCPQELERRPAIGGGLINQLLLAMPFVLCAAGGWFVKPAQANPPIDFSRDVKPLLDAKCASCHSSNVAASGLVTESPDTLFKGGAKQGPSVIRGNSAGSPLIRMLRGEIAPQMPAQGKPLPAAEIALVAQWIDGLAKPVAQAAVAVSSPAETFEREIRPIFEKSCFSCHNAGNHRGGLVLETAQSVLEGRAAVAGHSDRSALIQRLRGAKEPRMPLNGKPLSEEEIGKIAGWIDRLKAPAAAGDQKAQAKPAWPWIPLAEPPTPAVKRKEWVKNPIDAFVLAKLEQKGIEPAPSASGHALLRRLYFDLIGLPPTPDEMKRFLADPSPEAYNREVEKLLADSRYGERWGRFWLDLVRYADSRGGAIDYPRPHMWRYRDYVIRAFNQDRPYNRFVKEQLAGDTYQAFGVEGKLGLGFLGQWVQVEQVEAEQIRRDYLVDLVDTTGSVFLGLTLGCARCHNHKYDPLPTKDYYRIEAFFSPTIADVQDLPFHQYEMPKLEPDRWKKASEDWSRTLTERDKSIAQFREELQKRLEPFRILDSAQDLKDWADPGQRKYSVLADSLRTQKEKDRQKLIGRQTARFANPNSPEYYLPKAQLVTDSELHRNIVTKVLPGGNFKLASEEVRPGFLTAVTGNSEGVNLDGLPVSRRQLLANWIASSENPLTARVMVNRIWQYHFGKGLVATPSDFGRNGAGTVHQELLDWLAWRFVESGWSMKEIHRLILSSNTFQESMKHPDAKKAESIDPENRYFWMRDPIRIEVESIRDSILAVSGQLNPAMGGPPFFPEADDEQMARAPTWWEPSELRERNRRTVYMLQIRSFQLPMVKVFDGPNMDQSCVVRGVSSVTPQVFALFNSKFTHEQSAEMAKRIQGEAGPDPEKQIQRAFDLTFQRPPSESDRAMALKFLHTTGADASSKLADLCLVLLNMNEFIFLD
ncbi:MAG: DUF1553 domain-containing protein [Bryobacteraceae bacterium]